MIFRIITISFFLFASISLTNSQDCSLPVNTIFGSASGDERGISLSPTLQNDGFYVAGRKDDSTRIVKFDLSGEALWSRTFDIIPGKEENVNSMLLDSEGMLAISGTGGSMPIGNSVFVFRYDPNSHSVLWANEYIHTSRTNNFSIIQLGSGGNYLVSNNPYYTGTDDSELLSLNINTGNVEPGFSMNYDLGASEILSDVVHSGNFIYGTGRYTDGSSPAEMRNAIVKLNSEDGSQVWVKLGHRPASASARLYAADLIVDEGFIYSVYQGDPSGTSTLVTDFFVQKTTLDGELVWLNQYDLPGVNDDVYEIIKSGNGYVIMAGNRAVPTELELFKIDPDGGIMWARKFEFESVIENIANLDSKSSQLISVGNKLIFTGFAPNTTGGNNMFLIIANLEGETNNTCITNEPLTIPVIPVTNPTFYSVSPDAYSVQIQVNSLSPTGTGSGILVSGECTIGETIESNVDTTICVGEAFEGYSATGIYVDSFLAANGCDSIRTLTLTVNICEPECGVVIGSIYGSSESNEEGKSIVPTAENDGYYVAGSQDGLSMLSKFKLNGEVEWSRTFDVIPGEVQDLNTIFLDAEGMLVLIGTIGGTIPGSGIYIFRYDPANNLILWANEIETSTNSEAHTIIQRENNGNYIMSNNPHEPSNNDAELLEINKDNGTVLTSLAKNYHMTSTSSEQLSEIVLHGDHLYGVGRFTDGPSPQYMRHTLVKLDKSNGNPIWVKLGHVPESQSARLYGTDMVIDNDEIYSVYLGDPAGTSTTNRKLFIQKTSLDGDLVWLKQYELPGPTDHVDEIIKSEDGFVLLASKAASPAEIILFKIDTEGEVLWANLMQPASFITSIIIERGSSQLIELGNNLLFTLTGITENGTTDLIVVRTDLEGQVSEGCMTSLPMNISAQDVSNPVFYPVTPVVFDVIPELTAKTFDILESDLTPRQECVVNDTIVTTVEATICAGEIYEGYSQTGIFLDTFLTSAGCDSIRILDLTVLPAITSELFKNICHDEVFEGYTISGIYSDTFALSTGCDSIRILHLTAFACAPIIYYDLNACRSYMIDGSHMDYSEFVATYPEFSCAEITAEHVNQIPSPENKHSCTPGVNNTIAMCVGSYGSCTYSAGNPAAILIDFSVNPHEDSLFRFSALEFYEKAPPTYTWIDGPSGPNNYPLKYGIRILKDGVEIFRDEEIQTSQNWTLQSFSFIDEDLFRVEENAMFRIELLPYCPVGNGADVSAWDIDEIRIFGACAPIPEDKSAIFGNVITMNGKAISDVEIKLSEYSSFVPEIVRLTDEFGSFSFDELETGKGYFIKGYNNDKPLNGVSTLDLILIQKHLLGTIPFSTLNNYVAADANHSGNVSIVDLVEIQKLLLGKYSSFPQNTSWRFGVWPQNMNSSNISSFTEIQSIEYLASDPLRADFIGVKIGDINGDVHPDAQSSGIDSRSANEFNIWVEERKIEAGANFVLEIKSGEVAGIAGMQFALDMKGMNLASVMKGKLPVGPENYSMTNDGLFRFSWSTNELLHVAENEILFSITLTPSQTGLLSNKLELLKEFLSPEAYRYDDLEILKLKLAVVDKMKPLPGTDFFTVEPNPFNSELKITLNLIKEGNVEFNFYDISGRLIHRISKMFQQGEHTLIVEGNQLPVSEGVIYCQLKSNGFTSIQKLVKLE